MAVVTASSAIAQDESSAVSDTTTEIIAHDGIVIKENKTTYPVGNHAYILHDNGGRLILQDVVSRYKKGEITKKNQQSRILLPRNTSPTWTLFHVENTTDKEKWYLDMGSLTEGRSGILQKFLLYEVNQAEILYNGLQKQANAGTPLIDGRYFPLTISKDETATFLLYILPTNHKRVVLTPSLINELPTGQTQLIDVAARYLPTIIIGSTLILLVGFFIIKGAGFIPLIFYYFMIFAWWSFIEKPFFNSVVGIDTLALIAPVSVAFLIGLCGLLSIPTHNQNSAFRVLLILCLASCFAALAAFFVLLGQYDQLKFIASQIISLVTLLISIAFLLSHKSTTLQTYLSSLMLWIFAYAIGQIISLAANLLYIPYNAMTIHADYLVLYPQIVILFIGVIAAIKSDHSHRMDGFIRQMQKAQSILKAKKSKEENDNSKLLSVIEREREVMEELRARESERTEEMRDAKNSADEANQAKSAFLAVVSHEIRTPMTGVLGMLRMLQDTDLTPSQEDYVTTIKESSDAMVALLNDILDFSKIEDGKLSVEKIDFDLHRVLNGVAMLMKGHADQKSIELKLNIDSAVPNVLVGDPTRLRQVILNLVGNALKFTSKGHVAINVYIDPTHGSNQQHGMYPVYFSIEDTGIGISEEAQHNLFTPFAQADSSISRKYGGTGLGLTICKKLIDAMGGTINVKSSEGNGTSFFFTLPFSHNDDEQSGTGTINSKSSDPDCINFAETQENQSIPKGKKLRFLIIDDNEINRKVVKAFLDKENHESVVIYSGKEALELLKIDHNFDAIFLDIEMPDMNGKDVAMKILQDKTLPYIPIIALTGNISDDDLINYQQIGFHGCVAKPVTPEKLLATTGSILFGDGSNNGFKSVASNDLNQPTSNKDKAQPDKDMAEKTLPNLVNTSKTLDETMIKGLRDGLGTKQTIELLKDLFIKAEEIRVELKKSLNDSDAKSIHSRAHELKGMSANFGLKAVSEKSREIEHISISNDQPIQDIEPHLEDLSALLDRSKLALNEYFND